jgi:hypothetical protein
MELYGDLVSNLKTAVRSTQRLRGQRVYADTLDFWRSLLTLARLRLASMPDADSAAIASFATQLE